MTRKTTILLALATLTIPAWAQPMPELPKGHPVLPNMPKAAPAQPGAPANAEQLPTGHPDLRSMLDTKGAITIRVTQGTRGAPAPENVPVTIDLYSHGKLLNQLKGNTDAAGHLSFGDLPLQQPFQPLVRSQYAGVNYITPAKAMDFRQPGQQIDVTVYQTTETRPDFAVLMRHVSVEPAGNALRVSETINIQNPADKAWIGESRKHGKRQVLSIPLPPKADAVQISPLLADRCTVADGQFILTGALTPGLNSIEFIYLIPLDNQPVSLTFTAPAATKNMMLFLVDAGGQVTANGLKQTAAHQMGKAKAQIFNAADIAPGQQVSLTITGAKPATPPMPQLPKGHPPMP